MYLAQIALIMDDYDDAIEFFVGKLGFELIEDSPALTNDGRAKRWLVVRPPNSRTGLLLARADGEQQQSRAVGNQFAGRVGLFLRVDEFQTAYDRMRRRGVQFVAEPRTETYGQVAVFLDVAGNRWDLLGPVARSDAPVVGVGKTEREFFDTETVPWTPVTGRPGVSERLLARDSGRGLVTRMVRWAPGLDTSGDGQVAHDHFEEVLILSGSMHDLGLGETFRAGSYASRPPGMAHGPWITTDGCVMLETQYAS